MTKSTNVNVLIGMLSAAENAFRFASMKIS